MEAKFMKTSHSRAWECKPFIHGFMIFQLTDNMDIGVHIHTSQTQAFASNILCKFQAPLQQVHYLNGPSINQLGKESNSLEIGS